MPKPEPPTHLVEPDATTTRCGIKVKSKEALPYIKAEFVERYRGRFKICPSCDRSTD